MHSRTSPVRHSRPRSSRAFATAARPTFGLVVRIRGGAVVRVGGIATGPTLATIEQLCTDAKVGVDPKLSKIIGALGDGIARVEYGRAGDRAGVDVYLEPSEPADRRAPPPPASSAN